MKTRSFIFVVLLLLFVWLWISVKTGFECGAGIAWAQDDYAQRLVRDLEEAVKSGNQERILAARQRVQAHEQARVILNQRPALLRQLGQLQQSIQSPPTAAGAPVPAHAVSAAPAGSRVSVPADYAPLSSGGSKYYVPEGVGYQGVVKVDPPVSGAHSGTSYSQERLDIQNLARQIRPTPPDPKQVQEWNDSIRRPASADPPKPIEKFSGGDPSWSEINKRVTAASEPLYSKDQTRAVRDPDLARLANPDGKFVQAEEHTGLAQMAGRKATPAERQQAYQQSWERGGEKLDKFLESSRAGNKVLTDQAALDIRADPLAVKRGNIQELPAVKEMINRPLENIQKNMEPGIKDSIAQRYGVKSDQVTIHYSTNPRDPSQGPKIDQDTDITVRVGGKDVPADIAQPVVNEKFQQAAGGTKIAPGVSPEKFAEKHYMETTDRLSRQAYGSSPAEGEQILRGSKSQPLRDPNQVGMAMEDKFNAARNEAIELTRKGLISEAEVQRGLAMDQTVKQFDKQIQPRVEAMGGRVPDKVQAGIEIMRDVKEGRKSPVEAEEALRGMKETPESITQKATGLVEAGQKLQGPGRGGVSDRVAAETFNRNVQDRLDLKNLERQARALETGAFEPIDPSKGPGKGPGGGASSSSPTDTGAFRPVSGQTSLTEGRSSFQQPGLLDKARTLAESGTDRIRQTDQALERTLSLGELPQNASTLRSGLNTAGGAVLTGAAVAGSAVEGYSIGSQVGEGIKDYRKSDELRDRAQAERLAGREQAAQRLETQAERFENQGREKLVDAGKETAVFGGVLALGAVAPTAVGVVGAGAAGVAAYEGTRSLLEKTETGRKIDKGTENLIDRGMQAGEALMDDVRGLTGGQTRDGRNQSELSGRQSAYERALERGAVTLREGVTKEDLMDYLRTRNPAPTEKDGYTAADYQAGLNELISKEAPARDPQPAKIPPAVAESGGTVPVKSRQEQDLADFDQLQTLRNLQGAGQKQDPQPPVESGPAPEIKEPVKPPPPPDVPQDTWNRDFRSDYLASQMVDKFGGITDARKRQTAIADYLKNLRNAEQATGAGVPLKPGQEGAGGGSGLQLASNLNVAGSLQQTLDQQRQFQFQQTLGSLGSIQAERSAADQNRQAIDQSRVQAQGQQTNQAIAANAQEVVAAQQTLQTTRQNSLGNILLDAFMGGITSGTAVGIDRFGSTFGSAAGQQVTINWGIQPPPPVIISPPQTGTGATGSQTGEAQTGSTSQTATAPTTITTPTTGTGASGSGTGSGTRTTTQTASTSSGGTTTISRPPVKPPSTGGSKSCRVAGTCYYTGYADKNGCCSVCGKKVAKK